MENLYGLIGEKLGHTYSPQIHSKILEEINIKGHYAVFQVKNENLKDVIPGLKSLGYKGINVTIPYKFDIIQYLDALNHEAEKIGAVNVVNIDNNGNAIGYNTDYYGFGMMLNYENIEIKGKNAVILGTGGVSKAIVQYLKDNGINHITLITRDIESAKLKYPGEEIIAYKDLNKLLNYSIIINCTPLGMYPNIEFTPINKKYLKNFKTAIDLIYNPTDTLFLKQAKDEGLKTINGLYMLIAQALKSQEIWNDINISSDIIESITNLF